MKLVPVVVEHNVDSLVLNECCRAKLVRRESFFLPERLGTWVGGLELSDCPRYVAPGNA